MRQWTRWAAAVVALLAGSATPARDGAPPATAKVDAALYKSLREVINAGAARYNKTDHAGCYRVYQGGLIAAQGLLDHHPELQKAVSTGLAAAELDPLVWRRAFTLRAVLDKVRKGLAARPDAKDPGEEKPPVKEDGMKKAEEKKPEGKKDEKKPDEKKPDEKKSEEKKKEEKKAEEKKPEEKKEEKKDEGKKPQEKKDEKKAEEKKKEDEKKDDPDKGGEKKEEKKDDDQGGARGQTREN